VLIIARASVDLLPALADGRLHMPVDSVYSIADFAEAFARMAGNQHFGKIVLRMV
jgi:NADPH2:quinone reductase